jgi:hypothetical protein
VYSGTSGAVLAAVGAGAVGPVIFEPPAAAVGVAGAPYRLPGTGPPWMDDPGRLPTRVLTVAPGLYGPTGLPPAPPVGFAIGIVNVAVIVPSPQVVQVATEVVKP